LFAYGQGNALGRVCYSFGSVATSARLWVLAKSFDPSVRTKKPLKGQDLAAFGKVSDVNQNAIAYITPWVKRENSAITMPLIMKTRLTRHS